MEWVIVGVFVAVGVWFIFWLSSMIKRSGHKKGGS